MRTPSSAAANVTRGGAPTRNVAASLLGFALFVASCDHSNDDEHWLEPSRASEIRALSVRTSTPTSLQAQRGKVVLLSFGYTSCSDTCPTTLARMSSALQLLRNGADHVQVVYVTIDPERDTVVRFSEFMRAFDPRIDGWRVDPSNLGEVMAAYGVSAFKVPASISQYLGRTNDAGQDYSLDHTAAYWLIDRAGNLRVRLSHEASSKRLAEGIEKLLDG